MNYPTPPEGNHLVQALTELGWAGNNGYGCVALSWTEIKSYADVTGTLNEPWEFRCVREMSAAYVNEKQQDSPLRIAPYDRVTE